MRKNEALIQIFLFDSDGFIENNKTKAAKNNNKEGISQNVVEVTRKNKILTKIKLKKKKILVKFKSVVKFLKKEISKVFRFKKILGNLIVSDVITGSCKEATVGRIWVRLTTSINLSKSLMFKANV